MCPGMLGKFVALWLLRISCAEVYYVCFDDEHQSIVDIHCEPGMVLKIEEAGYGRSRWGMCRDLIKTTRDHKCYALTNTTMECCGLGYCDLQVKRTYIESCDYRPASFLKIIYECVPEKSRFACGPPRLNTPTDGTHPVFLPGEHVLGDVDFPPYPPTETEPEPVNTSAPNDTEPTSRVKQQGDQGDHQEVRTNSNAADVEAASKAPTKKMAIMMITPPPDVRGYRIVNEDGSEHKPDETWHILHGNDAVAVWACLGVGLLIIFLLTMVLIYLCKRSPDHTKAQEVCPSEATSGHHHRGKPQYQESEFGCKRYPDPQQPVPTSSPEHNNNQLHKSHPRVLNRKNNSHINRAFADDFAHKVVVGPRKRSEHGAGLCGGGGGAGLIVTPQDPVSACLRSPSSIISLSDDENSSLTDSGVETTSKQGSRQNSRGKDVKKKAAPVLKASHNRSGSAKRPTSLDVPPECHRMKVKGTNDIHDIIVL